MNDVRLHWTVLPWNRVEDDGPTVAGARIVDSKRQVAYLATVDAQGHLDYLAIELTGHIDTARVARLKSIPRERIEATVAAFVKDEQQDVIHVVMEGGLLAAPSDEYGSTPSAARVAELMTRHGWRRQELAAYFGAKVRTVDGWIARARQELGDAVPRPATGAGYRSTTPSDE